MKTRTHRPASIERVAVVSTNRIDEELQRYDAYFRLTAREIGFFTASQFLPPPTLSITNIVVPIVSLDDQPVPVARHAPTRSTVAEPVRHLPSQNTTPAPCQSAYSIFL